MINMPGGEEDADRVMRMQRSKYGLGDRRTIDQLIQFSGIDLHNAKFPLDGQNRCGNIRWVPFIEHPGGVNHVPRFDMQTEEPLDLPYDKTSVWYDPRLDAHHTAVSGNSDVGGLDRLDGKAALEGEEDKGNREEGDVNGIDVQFGRDNKTLDIHKNPDRHYKILEKAINAEEEEVAKAAKPILSNAEAHGIGDLKNAQGRDAAASDKKAATARRVGKEHKWPALRRRPDISVVKGAMTTPKHGVEFLPLPVQIAVLLLVLGLAIAIFMTAGTGQFNQHKRNRKERTV